MFLHIGGDVAVPVDEVVAILDAQPKRWTTTTKEFFAKTRASGRLWDVSGGDVNAYVVTPAYVYASPISSVTLKKRAEGSRSGLFD